jgi:hypothetical protein
MMEDLGLKDWGNFSEKFLGIALAAGLIERTLPGALDGPRWKYRLSASG